MGRPRKTDIEQPALIDVEPENQKVILKNARSYLKIKDQCHELAEASKKALNKLRESIKDADLQPLEGNIYRIQCGDHIIEMIPQSEKVKIKDVKRDGEGEEGADESTDE